MSEPVIHCQGVRFRYGAGLPWVLEDVELSVQAGEVACLVGPNGGGKSTLLRLWLGLLEPTHGQVRLWGQAPRQGRARLGYTPQKVELDRLFPMRAREVVAMGRLGPKAWGWPSRADRQAVAEALDIVDLASAAERPFATLSGGQQQRVLIARALVSQPDLLLLDEPTAMTDAHLETRLVAQLKSRRAGLTVVIVTHDMGFAAPLAERILCVNRTLVEHPASALTPESIHALYGEAVQPIAHADHLHPPHA